MDYPTPDFSKIQTKVNCWKSKHKFGGKGEEILVRNDIVTCIARQHTDKRLAEIE
jgi:hypothetical protein